MGYSPLVPLQDYFLKVECCTCTKTSQRQYSQTCPGLPTNVQSIPKCPKMSCCLCCLSYRTRWYNTVDPTVYQNLSMLIFLLSILSYCTIWDRMVQHGTSHSVPYSQHANPTVHFVLMYHGIGWYSMIHPTAYCILSAC